MSVLFMLCSFKRAYWRASFIHQWSCLSPTSPSPSLEKKKEKKKEIKTPISVFPSCKAYTVLVQKWFCASMFVCFPDRLDKSHLSMFTDWSLLTEMPSNIMKYTCWLDLSVCTPLVLFKPPFFFPKHLQTFWLCVSHSLRRTLFPPQNQTTMYVHRKTDLPRKITSKSKKVQ